MGTPTIVYGSSLDSGQDHDSIYVCDLDFIGTNYTLIQVDSCGNTVKTCRMFDSTGFDFFVYQTDAVHECEMNKNSELTKLQ